MLLLLMYNIIQNHVTAEPPLSKQVYWSSSYFLFFIKHSNPFVKTQTKDCFTQTSLKSMHTVKNNYFFFVPKLKTWIRLSRLTSLSHNSSHPLRTGHCCESILQILYNLQTTKLYASRKPLRCMFLLRLQKAIRTNTGGKGRWKAQGMNDQNQVNKHKQFTERERNFMARRQPECMNDPYGDF